jgi:hypothetical protein
VHAAAPGSDEPVPHATQVAADVAPVAALKVFAGQRVQGAVPAAAAYVPAGQGVQAPPSKLVCPAGHAVQPATEVAPAAPAPKPAGHGRHDAGGCENICAGHVVTVNAQVGEAAGLYAPAHEMHAALEVLPKLGLNVPAAQGVAAPAPAGQKEPDGHCTGNAVPPVQ